MRYRVLSVAAALAVIFVSCAPPSEPTAFDVAVHHVPEIVYTSVQGEHFPAAEQPSGAHAETQKLTWLFHLVLESNETDLLRVARVDAAFQRAGTTIWKESLSRAYLERTEWIDGAFADTTEYFMDNIEFVDNAMASMETAVGPELPPGDAVSWVRIPFARKWFAEIDSIEMTFHLETPEGRAGVTRHSVPIVTHRQRAELRLPFDGAWVAHAGNDLTTGHRRTGLNSLTMYGWDFTKIGPNGLPYKTDGKTPADYWAYDEPVLAPGDGIVVDVRDDIAEYGIGVTPPRDVLEKDGDVFAGNLVTIDHGSGEFSLTCHMRAGTVTVEEGDEVKAGQVLGRTGNSGVSQVPHIHLNLMDGAAWLEAKGVPALFENFVKIRAAGDPIPVELGNPMSGWFVEAVP